jgi:hypothetical protein
MAPYSCMVSVWAMPSVELSLSHCSQEHPSNARWVGSALLHNATDTPDCYSINTVAGASPCVIISQICTKGQLLRRTYFHQGLFNGAEQFFCGLLHRRSPRPQPWIASRLEQ